MLHRTIWEVVISNCLETGRNKKKKYRAGDWMRHLFITVYHVLASTNQITGVDAVGKIKGKLVGRGEKIRKSCSTAKTFSCRYRMLTSLIILT